MNKISKNNYKNLREIITVILIVFILLLLLLGVVYIIDPLKLPFALNRPFIEKTLDTPKVLLSKQAGDLGVLRYSAKLLITDDYNNISKKQLTSETNLYHQTVFSINNINSDFSISNNNNFLLFDSPKQKIIRIGILCDINKSSLLKSSKNYDLEINNNTILDIENFDFKDENYICCVVFPEKGDSYDLLKRIN